ncbi:unnamed protein product [Phyllotreta striolata]|uniref:C2H2-type domain-containing protein n=1 Tax=Phyllotreta striolata TaxID=444603 RepID=A0A9N9TJ32_PHYSR|nr:unnamed protein product [Phyllotreta striolata]
MEEQEVKVKRKSRLAVFEHVVKRERSKKRKYDFRLNGEDSSPSESELVIDDEKEPVKRRKKPPIKLTEEPLSLECKWDDCTEVYTSWEKYNDHLKTHSTEPLEDLSCKWKNCDESLHNQALLIQHVGYHGYVAKLKNLGDNIATRNKLPPCKESHNTLIPLQPIGYECEWEYCSSITHTMFDFLNHMRVHVKNNPSTATDKEPIDCCWRGCATKYSTQMKLADHLKVHTKEKMVGCPTCSRLFANTTKFCDHRKRQLSLELQSYQCSRCLKLFPSERLLRDHMRLHVNHYKCNMCDMTCLKPSLLAKHIRFRHIKYKPYKCPECEKTFVEKCNLDTHIRTHKKEAPFACCVCDFQCRSQVALETHYVKKHDSVGAIYECHCCKKKLKRGRYLTRHLMKRHNFHYPSGHSRFRYQKEEDGIYRLETVRYESLEVTQEMIRSESMQNSISKQIPTCNLNYNENDKTEYVLSLSVSDGGNLITGQKVPDNNIVITINDLDEEGNILKSEELESTIKPANEVPSYGKIIEIGQVANNERKQKSENNVEIKPTILDYEFFKHK